MVKKHFLTLVLLLMSTMAIAMDFEISIGRAQYKKPPNGVWYQDGFANDFQRTPRTYAIGAGGYISESVRYHVGYVNLGGVDSAALAVADDKNYNGMNGCVGQCLPLSHWYGRSSLDGFYATVAPEYSMGRWKVFFEIGLWYFNPKFTMDIPDWTPCMSCTPQHLTVHYTDGRRFGPVSGIGFQYGNTQFLVKMYGAHPYGLSSYPPNYGRYVIDYSIRQLF